MSENSSNKRLIVWVVAICGLVLFSTVAAIIVLVNVFPDIEQSEEEWVHIEVTGSIAEMPGSIALFGDPSDMPAITTELASAIRDAAQDDSVSGIYLDIRAVSMGWAQLQEIRTAIDAFREAGKDCIAWAGSYDNKSYYLASGCTEVHLAPAGLPMVHGLSLTRMYFHGLFERFDISPNFEAVGEFKSAVEPYLLDGPSVPAQEANETLLDGLYDQLIDGIARGRGIDAATARDLVENPPITPEDAVRRGLVDHLSYRDEMEDTVIPSNLRPFGDYLRSRRSEWETGTRTIAVIYAEGTIIDGQSSEDFTGGRYIGDRTLSRQIRNAREDDEVAAVVLRINSPGGSGSASDAIWREVALTTAQKPVVISMGDYAASGGYYISMGSDWIVAEPGTLTGSIGVFGGKINLAGLLREYGITTHTTRRGEYSTLLSAMEDFTPEQRTKFRQFLESFYDRFVNLAAQGRGMTYEELHAHAQGRVWTGDQAMERGLVDELGGLDTAIDRAAELANIEDPRIRRIPEAQTFFESLIDDLSDPDMAHTFEALGIEQEAISPLIQLRMVTRSESPILLLPGNLVIE